MVQFKATIKKFKDKGEKSGWTYIEISKEIILQIKGDHKKSFRIKGKLDNYPIKRIALLPMGEGNFIMPLNATMRKGIKKNSGTLIANLEEDQSEFQLNPDFSDCLDEDEQAKNYFLKLPNGHKNYFNNWINSAKSAATIAKRIAMVLDALSHKMDFGEMIRNQKKLKL